MSKNNINSVWSVKYTTNYKPHPRLKNIGIALKLIQRCENANHRFRILKNPNKK